MSDNSNTPEELQERQVKALEKIAYNMELVADAVDDLAQSDWGERLEYYLYLLKLNHLPKREDD